MILIQPATPTAAMGLRFRPSPSTILTALAVPIAPIVPPIPTAAAYESKGSEDPLTHLHRFSGPVAQPKTVV